MVLLLQRRKYRKRMTYLALAATCLSITSVNYAVGQAPIRIRPPLQAGPVISLAPRVTQLQQLPKLNLAKHI